MTTPHTDAHLHRSRQIAQTLVRHGLAHLVGVLGSVLGIYLAWSIVRSGRA